MPTVSTDASSIERDLDQTRSRLGSHLSELQDRLSPGQVLDDLMGYFRGSEGAEFGRSLMDSVRGNPLPAAITTVGLAWLMASNPRGGAVSSSTSTVRPVGLPIYGHDDHAATMTRLGMARATVTRGVDEADHLYTARLDQAHGQAIGLARHAEETGESFGQRVKNAVASVEQAVAGTTSGLRDQAGNLASSAGGALSSFAASAQGAAQDASSYAGSAFAQGTKLVGQNSGSLVAAISESPVLLGALGLAAGALLGALLPHSDQEEAALGGIAGQARDAVRTLANEGIERGSRVVQAVTDTARSSVQDQKLAGGKSPGELVDAALSGELAGSVKNVAANVLKAGDEAVRKEGLGEG